MLRLNLQKEPYWLTLPSDVKVKVRPLTSALMNAAQAKVIKEIAGVDKQKVDEHLRHGQTEALLIKTLAQAAVIEWEGILESNGDKLAPLNDHTIADLMEIWFISQDFWRQYSSSLQLLETEGKGLGHALNGTLAAARNTAATATKKAANTPVLILKTNR